MPDEKKLAPAGEREPLQNGTDADTSITESTNSGNSITLHEYIEEHFDILEELSETWNVSCPRCRNTFARVRKMDGTYFCPSCSSGKSETLSSVAAGMGWEAPPVGAVPDRRFKLVRASELKYKRANWLIKGYLTKKSLSVVFADPGAMKTFLVISMGFSISSGCGLWYQSKASSGPVVYIAGEGQAGLILRLKALSEDTGLNLDDIPFYVSSMPAAMIEPSALNETVKAILDDIPEPPVLIIIDTLNRNFGPGDENSGVDMTCFVQACDVLRDRFEAAVMIVHHAGHSFKNRSRGHSALIGSLDFEYRMDKGSDGVIRFENTKIKEYEKPEPLAFRPESITLPFIDEDGKHESSIVLRQTSFEPAPKAGTASRGKWQTLALETLDRITEEHRRNVEDSGRDPDIARVSWDAWRDACRNAGMPRQRLNDTLFSLVENGDVSRDLGFVSRA